ncbi:MAG: hypothetical protein E7345_02085 [Clostridiales bacterium]|nr:hypothetical protein [Clostridiales bacterium]
MTENKKHKETYKDRYIEKLKNSYNENVIGKSSIYYLLIIVMSLCSLVVTWILLNNTMKIASLENFFELYGFRQWLMVFVVFVVVILLKSLMSYLKIYVKSKRKNFYAVYSSVSISEYLSRLSLYGRVGDVSLWGKLVERKTKENLACDVVYSKKFYSKVAFVLVGLTCLIWSLFMMDVINIWLYMLVLLIVLWQFAMILLVIITRKNKALGISIVGKTTKFLFNIKIIKDYEKTFNNLSDKLLIYTNSINNGKIISISETVANMIIWLFRVLIIYLSMNSLLLSDASVMGEILIKCFMLEAILSCLPLPGGIIAYELLFITLFKNIVVNGYLFYVMVIYRVFELFMYLINYLIVVLVDKIVYKNKTVSKITTEE